ncbi:MAG: hypothetical protein ABJC89_14930, partial [Acidobacteriota bacterium]
MLKRVAMVMVVALAGAAAASAQSSTTASGQASGDRQTAGTTASSTSQAPQPGSTAQQGAPASRRPAMAGDMETRPATTTTEGDTGLWFVPTGEIL